MTNKSGVSNLCINVKFWYLSGKIIPQYNIIVMLNFIDALFDDKFDIEYNKC